jgi:glutathione synthase/RimK-type ligase-like ATP-grasp enzyme
MPLVPERLMATSIPRRVALATSRQQAELDADSRPLVALLAKRGVVATAAVWDEPQVVWSSFDVVVIRSTWDYTERIAAFLHWVDGLPAVLNAASVVRWNADKRYLLDLAAAGVPIVPTRSFEPGDRVVLPAAPLVVKPAVGASARQVAWYRAGQEPLALQHVEALLAAGQAAIVQSYLPQVEQDGELDLVFIGGHYSHAVRRGPVLGESAALGPARWEERRLTTATAEQIALAGQALRAVPARGGPLLYARVDLLSDGDGSDLVSEVELIEPCLFHSLAPDSAERLADEIAAAAGLRPC